MQSNQTPIFEFRKSRDFGQLFIDVFRFIKFNSKTIFVCVLVISGPFFLIAGAFYGYLQSLGSNPSQVMGFGLLKDPMGIVSIFMSAMFPYFIFLWLGSLASTATINRYFILYQERKENNSVRVVDIIKYLPGDVWRLFYNNLLFGCVLLAVMMGAFVVALIPILGALALFVALLLAGPQMMYAITAGNYLVLRDEILITAAYGKAWSYMRGKFWWTWLIVVCAGLIIAIIGAVFTLPITILTLAHTFTRLGQDVVSEEQNGLLYIILGTIAVLGPHLLTPVTTLFSVLTYHGYEEAEEGNALKEKIEKIDR